MVHLLGRRVFRVRGTGARAYRAGWRGSEEDVEDNDPPGNPLSARTAPRGRFRGGGNSSERPPARRRSLGISRRMAVSQQRRLPRERFVGKEASGACFPGDENRSYLSLIHICFPGVPLAIFLPDTHFVLMDSLLKRVEFLRGVIEELSLNAEACLLYTSRCV